MNELKRQRLPSKHHGEIVQDSTLTPMARPFVLILVPTRELAIQVYNEMVDLSSGTWIQPGALYGGTSRKEQAAMLAHGCNILVGTPGRVIDIASWSYIDGVKTLSLDNLSHIVLDEADELLAISFAEQMLKILNLALVSGDLHYWFFSSQYMEEHINKAKLLMSSSHIDVSFDMPEENSAIRYALVKQNFIEVSEDRTERFDILMSILAQNKQTKILILCETHDSVEWLHGSLVALDIPFRSTHGDYSQERREEAILRFKRGTVPVLVSTMGVGGRGLNLQGVDCLIFWEMPESLDRYKWCLRRVGR